MIIALVGSFGVGLVWGWLVASVFASVQKSVLNVLLLGFATLLVLSEAIWMAGQRSAAVLDGMFGCADVSVRKYSTYCWTNQVQRPQQCVNKKRWMNLH